MEYEVEYTITNYGGTITLDRIYPSSDYVEEMFYSGVLMREVNLDDDGMYRLTIHVADDGFVSVNRIEEYVGWVIIE